MEKCIVCEKIIKKGLSCKIEGQYKAHFKCWIPLLPKPLKSLKLLSKKERSQYKKIIEQFTKKYLHSRNIKHK